MSATMYEQFFSRGSVKSLMTGFKVEQPLEQQKTPEDNSSDALLYCDSSSND